MIQRTWREITWTPPAELVGQTVEVEALAEDGRGGSALHRFNIAVVADSANRPPIIVTEPELQWYLPSTETSSATGDVDPDSLNLALEDGQRSTQTVSLTFPPAEIPGADIVFVVDESGSMAGGHQWLRSMITNLESGLVDKGVTSNRYALVGYGRSNPTPRLVETWTDAVGLEDAVGRLVTSGGTEDGYEAIAYAFDQLDARESASKQFVLITDEDRDFRTGDTFGSILDQLTLEDVGLHSVVDATYQDVLLANAFGGDADGTAFIEEVNGQYSESIAFEVVTAFGTTEVDYIDLAFQSDGTAWDINQLERDDETVLSFTGAFVDQISESVVEDLAIDLAASSPDVNFLNLTGIQPGGEGTTVSFDVEFIGNGSASLFDLQFVRASDPSVTFGSIPVSIQVPYRYDVDAIDPDEDPINYSLLGETHGAAFDNETGLLAWAPTAPGSYTFTARADDGRGGEDSQVWTVEVLSDDQVNTPPEFGPLDPINLLIDQDARWNVPASDADGDVLRYQLASVPSEGRTIPDGMAIDRFSGAITWRPTEDQVGTYLVDVVVADPRGGSDRTTITINVGLPDGFVNERPRFVSEPVSEAFVGGTYRYDAIAVDPENEVITYELVFGPDGMTLDSGTGRIAWNPTLDQAGETQVYVRATDVRGAFDLQVFTIAVTDLNAAPEITSEPTAPSGVGRPWQYPVVATDPNGDPLLYEVDPASLDRGVQIDATTGVITWTPTEAGTFTTIVRVSDPAGKFDTQIFSLTLDSNSPPRITSTPEGTLYVSETFSYPITTEDDDGDAVTLRIDPASAARGVTLDGATLRWTPTRTGEFTTTITADDGRGGTSTQTLTLPVYARTVDSQPPEITSVPEGPIYANTPWDYSITAIDPDGDDAVLVYELVDDGTGDDPLDAGETVDFVGQTLTWTTPIVRSRTFTIGVTDEAGVQTTQTFTATSSVAREGRLPQITSVPQAPAVVGETYEYQVTAFDPDGDELRFALTPPVSGATIDPLSGLLTFVPTTTTPTDFVVQVSDVDTAGNPLDGSVTQSFTLTVVEPAGTPPQIVSAPTGPARPERRVDLHRGSHRTGWRSDCSGFGGGQCFIQHR